MPDVKSTCAPPNERILLRYSTKVRGREDEDLNLKQMAPERGHCTPHSGHDQQHRAHLILTVKLSKAGITKGMRLFPIVEPPSIRSEVVGSLGLW